MSKSHILSDIFTFSESRAFQRYAARPKPPHFTLKAWWKYNIDIPNTKILSREHFSPCSQFSFAWVLSTKSMLLQLVVWSKYRVWMFYWRCCAQGLESRRSACPPPSCSRSDKRSDLPGKTWVWQMNGSIWVSLLYKFVFKEWHHLNSCRSRQNIISTLVLN